jgi:hypothetical protein
MDWFLCLVSYERSRVEACHWIILLSSVPRKNKFSESLHPSSDPVRDMSLQCDGDGDELGVREIYHIHDEHRNQLKQLELCHIYVGHISILL